MNEHCKKTIDHISRLQGQLESLKKRIESGANCKDIAQLALASSRSFDSLRGKIVQGYIQEHWFDNKPMNNTQTEDFEQLLKIIKS